METIKRRTAYELLGVREPAKNARDRLLDMAIDLFYSHGFHAVGLDRIIDETGVTKTTFYKHFESKDDLLVAAVEKRHRWEQKAWADAVFKRVGNDPQAQLLAMFDVMDDWFNRPDFGGCIFMNAAAEFVDPNDPVHQIATRHKAETREAFLQMARAAGLVEPATFADLYTTLLEGALIMRHFHRRNDAARVARVLVVRLLDEHTPRKARGRSKGGRRG